MNDAAPVDASAFPACAVIVTFHPDASCAERINRIVPQVGSTFIVDNGSAEQELTMLRAVADQPKVNLICHGENRGVAAALNHGLRQARGEGYRFALLLDQDTTADEDMVDRLQTILASIPESGRVAAIGSRFRDTAGGTAESLRLVAQGAGWREVESVITSGTLLSVPIHAQIGAFRDDFFIDHVDTEYCLRARAAGYHIIETIEPLMSHTVGTPTAHRMFGFTTWTTNHSPDRRYYMSRNNTVLLREYGTADRSPWQWKSAIRCLRACKRIAYYESDKVAKIEAVLQGWWDAIRHRMGPRRG